MSQRFGNSELIASLKAALKSLDLQLEDELTRYQQRRTERTPDAALLASIEEQTSEASTSADQNALSVSDHLEEPMKADRFPDQSGMPPQFSPDSSLEVF